MKSILIFTFCIIAISNLKAATPPRADDCDCHYRRGVVGGCVLLKVLYTPGKKSLLRKVVSPKRKRRHGNRDVKSFSQLRDERILSSSKRGPSYTGHCDLSPHDKFFLISILLTFLPLKSTLE